MAAPDYGFNVLTTNQVSAEMVSFILRTFAF